MTQWRTVQNGELIPNAIDRYPHLPGFTYTNILTGGLITISNKVCLLFPSERIVVNEDGQAWSVDAAKLDQLYQAL